MVVIEAWDAGEQLFQNGEFFPSEFQRRRKSAVAVSPTADIHQVNDLGVKII